MSISTNFDLTKIRHHKDGQSHSFEDFCCYLFRNDSEVPQDSIFRRIQGKGGDGGVEAIHRLSNGEVWGCQVKYMFDLNQALHACKKSFETALSNYKELSRYVICVPFNLTGKKKGPSGKQLEGKWAEFDNWKEELENLIPKGRTVVIDLWCEDDLQIKFLSTDSTGGLIKYWFDDSVFPETLFSIQLKTAIKQAGDRYSPRLNVNTPLIEKFHFFSQINVWNEIISKLSRDCVETYKSWDKSFEQDPTLKTELKLDLSPIGEKISNISQDLIIALTKPEILVDSDFQAIVKGQYKNLTELENVILSRLLEKHGKNADTQHFRQFSANFQVSFPMQPLDELRKLKEVLDGIIQLYSDQKFELAASNTVLICGEAGIGKTHGIVDLARQRDSQGLRSLVFFGENFTDEDPWITILNYLGLSNSIGRNELLAVLNAIGENSGYPLILFIDALNESKERGNWRHSLPRLCSEISNYPFLKLCVSCRDNFVRQVIPKSLNICEVRHNGFMGMEVESQIAYSKHYKLGVPENFYFNKEFSNPLFLGMFFESLKEFRENLETKDYKDISSHVSISSIIKLWFKAKNRKILDKLEIDSRENELVRESLDKLADMMISQNSRLISLKEVRFALNEVVGEVVGQNFQKFFSAIEDESLISIIEQIEPSFEKESKYYVRFTFERVGDYLIAGKLISSIGNVGISLKPEEKLYEFVANEDKILENSGVLEAISVLWPEKIKNEFIDYVEYDDNPELNKYFISSLYWRDPKYISNRTIELVWKLICQNDYVVKGFESLFEISTRKEHRLNADFLHEYFIKQKMVHHRDGFWAFVVGESFSNWSEEINSESPVNKLTDLDIYLQSSQISTQTSLLWATIICWFLASPDRRIRDRGTKVLTAILEKNPDIAVMLLRRFHSCDDEYITERLLVAIYGAFLLNNSSDDLYEVTRFLFDNYCTEEEFPLNVCIRDHIRMIVELAISLNSVHKSVDILKVRSLVSKSNNVIDFSKDLVRPEIEEKFIPNLDIGKMSGMKMDSDFSKYIVQPNIREIVDSEFKSKKSNFENLNNGFLNAVINMGYPGERNRCANFDYLILEKFGTMRGKPGWAERLGKKYNWIILKQFMGQLNDQNNMNNDSSALQKELMLQGLNLRDIDPTDLRLNLLKFEENVENYSIKKYSAPISEINLRDWCKNDDFGDVTEFIVIHGASEKRYFALNVENNWNDQNEFEEYAPYRNVHMKFNSALVKVSDLEKVKEEFSKEYSGQFFDFYNEPSDYHGYLGEWCEYGPNFVKDKNPMGLTTRLNQIDVNFLSGQLLRENNAGQDFSSPCNPKRLFVPSPKLIKFGGLKWNKIGDWKDIVGESVLVNPWWNFEGEFSGIIGSASFINEYLQENDEAFVLFCYQEKSLINFSDEYERKIIETMLQLDNGKFEIIAQKDRKW